MINQRKIPKNLVGLGGGGGGATVPPPTTSQNFDKPPLTKILSLPSNVPLHLVWHPLPSISHPPPMIWYI